jgi:hypothetical protein
MVYNHMMAHSRGTGADPQGFYPTPEIGTRALVESEQFTGPIWEPACGDGAMAKVLQEVRNPLTGRRVRVISTDLYDRGLGGGVDFLKETKLRAPNIVTNPPYQLAEKFVHHALDLGASKVCMLLRLMFLEGTGRKSRIYDVRPPSRIHVFSFRLAISAGAERAYYAQQNGKGGVTPYAWFVWDSHEAPGQTTVHWI